MRTEQFIKKWLSKGSFIALAIFSTITYAQKPFLNTNIHGYKPVDLTRTITDTLDQNFDSATVTLYASPNGGFVGGNTGFGETARAQEFDVDTAYYVDGFIYWFGYLAHESAASDSSKLMLRFWKNNLAVVIGGIPRVAPNSLNDTAALSLDTLNADTIFGNGMNVWMLAAPKLVTANYSVGFSMEHLHYKDTVSLMMSGIGDPPVSYLSWEKWNGNWDLILNTWSIDADYAVFPLVDQNTASIESDFFIEGLKYSMYPNPSTDWMNIEMEVERANEYTIIIHDLSGRLVKTHNVGYLNRGKVSTSIDVFDMPSGNYILTITDGRKGLSKKFIKN